MLALCIISLCLILCNSFELRLIPKRIDHDINLYGLTDLLHNIPFDLPTTILCIGTPSQCFNLALGTSCSFSVLESSESKELMLNTQFNPRRSSSFTDNIQNRKIGGFLMGISYYYFDGFLSGDVLTIPIETEKSTIPFKFVLKTSDKKYPHLNFDGFLGLQKVIDNMQYFGDSQFSLMENLIRSKYITKKSFGIEYNSQGGRILFGEEEYYANYKKCNSSTSYRFQYKWDCSLNEIRIGKTIKTIPITTRATFEAMESFIFAHETAGGDFVLEYIIKHYPTYCRPQKQKNNTVIICNEDTDIASIPDLILRMNETQLVIQWVNVFKMTEIDGVKKYIGAFIVGNVVDYLNRDHWSIGVPGFIDNSILFDHDNNSIGVKYLKEINKGRMPDLCLLTKTILLINFSLITIGIILLVFMNSKSIGINKETLV